MNCDDTRKLLNVYADDELDLVNHLEIERHLKDCPGCTTAYKNLMTLKTDITGDIFYYHAPPELKKRIQTSLREISPEQTAPPFWQWRWMPAFVTSLAVVALLIVGLFFLRTNTTSEDLIAQEIVSAHIRSMMANHLTDVPSTDQHTVKPWFEGKLDFSPPVVDLISKGFPLIGGRLDYAGSRPVAALVYQRRQHFINLFVFPSADNSDGGNKMSMRQGYNLIHWSRSGMTFWAVSDINLGELQEFAQALQN